jgi:hypothetical protein
MPSLQRLDAEEPLARLAPVAPVRLAPTPERPDVLATPRTVLHRLLLRTIRSGWRGPIRGVWIVDHPDILARARVTQPKKEGSSP